MPRIGSLLAGPYTRENIILLVMDGFAKRGLNRVRQYELHKAVWKVTSKLGLQMRFITSPTIYSDDLDALLHKLERDRLLSELVIVHNGWVPKRMYEMTTVGKMIATETAQKISLERRLVLQMINETMER